MAAQPSDADISQMMSITDIVREEAILRLKGNNNDVSQAVNEMFENPESRSRYLWDETQFNSDRDGSNTYGGISFQVHAADDHGPNSYLSAPSRPPSRATSPIGRVISLVDEHARASAESRMTKAELADDQLRQALEESVKEAWLPPQEYGVTGTSSVHFGPANRPDYENGQWQMVHVSSMASQAQNPEPADRQREQGTPAFLKPSTQAHRLASLITIYHGIPLAREIFLDRDNTLPDFGHNSEWWAGKSIERKTSTHVSGSGSPPSEILNSDDQELLHELQRLMAFLDMTDRSYGSANSLANMHSVKHADGTDGESRFFDAWNKASHSNEALKVIFTSAVQPKQLEVDNEIGVDPDRKEFAILDLEFPPNDDDFNEIETLYDLADMLLWQLSGLDVSSSAFLSHLGEVISFRLPASPSSKSVKIPETWYPDRYLESGRERALEMRKHKAAVREKLMKISNLENKLMFFVLSGGRVVKVHDLFSSSLMHDVEPICDDDPSEVNGVPFTVGDTEMSPEPRIGDKIDISGELKKVLTSIDAKLTALKEEKEKARASLHELSKLYTEPSSDQSLPTLHPYKLCGVSTKSGVTYLRMQAEADLIDMDLDANGATSNNDEWWKLVYIATDVKPVSVTKVSIDEVLEAAIETANSPLIVYASEKALSEPVKPAPESLNTFVRADNLAFKGEFSSPSQPASPNESFSPQSPAKRKYDESEQDSQDNFPRYTEPETRWGGMSPSRDDKQVHVSHRELSNPDENDTVWRTSSASESGGDSITPRAVELDVIMGQDPNELVDVSDSSLVPSNKSHPGPEMKEKRPMSTLAMAMEEPSTKTNATQSMDMDDITRD